MSELTKNPRYLIYRDLIGLKVSINQKLPPKKIKKRNNPGFIFAGTVIDETHNMLITSTEEDPSNYLKNSKKWIKKNYLFRFEIPAEIQPLTVEVDGEKILKRPENRIKLLRSKKIKKR